MPEFGNIVYEFNVLYFLHTFFLAYGAAHKKISKITASLIKIKGSQ